MWKVRRFLGTDYNEALNKLRGFKGSEVRLVEVTVTEAAKRWLASYVETARNEKNRKLAKRRVETHLVPALGHYLVSTAHVGTSAELPVAP